MQYSALVGVLALNEDRSKPKEGPFHLLKTALKLSPLIEVMQKNNIFE
jgi:hypothetical protein